MIWDRDGVEGLPVLCGPVGDGMGVRWRFGRVLSTLYDELNTRGYGYDDVTFMYGLGGKWGDTVIYHNITTVKHTFLLLLPCPLTRGLLLLRCD
jgi:hypothetical protein